MDFLPGALLPFLFLQVEVLGFDKVGYRDRAFLQTYVKIMLMLHEVLNISKNVSLFSALFPLLSSKSSIFIHWIGSVKSLQMFQTKHFSPSYSSFLVFSSLFRGTTDQPVFNADTLRYGTLFLYAEQFPGAPWEGTAILKVHLFLSTWLNAVMLTILIVEAVVFLRSQVRLWEL